MRPTPSTSTRNAPDPDCWIEVSPSASRWMVASRPAKFRCTASSHDPWSRAFPTAPYIARCTPQPSAWLRLKMRMGPDVWASQEDSYHEERRHRRGARRLKASARLGSALSRDSSLRVCGPCGGRSTSGGRGARSSGRSRRDRDHAAHRHHHGHRRARHGGVQSRRRRSRRCLEAGPRSSATRTSRS